MKNAIVAAAVLVLSPVAIAAGLALAWGCWQIVILATLFV